MMTFVTTWMELWAIHGKGNINVEQKMNELLEARAECCFLEAVSWETQVDIGQRVKLKENPDFKTIFIFIYRVTSQMSYYKLNIY